jgi:hypothetical protein
MRFIVRRSGQDEMQEARKGETPSHDFLMNIFIFNICQQMRSSECLNTSGEQDRARISVDYREIERMLGLEINIRECGEGHNLDSWNRNIHENI